MEPNGQRTASLSNTDFLKALEEKKPKIYKSIIEYLPRRYPLRHYEMVRDYPERQGKYLRPVLVLLANELFGGKEEDAMLTAAAMQTSEEWILIHDDIQDDSEERRGKLCLHRIHGPELAMNAGDALHVIMWKMLTDNYEMLTVEKAKKISNLMYNILLRTCEGQYLELSWIKNGKIGVSESDYYKMIDRKAGAYSIYGPLQLGAAVAGATDDEIESIEEWGTPFGRAFMIHDDVLNLTGDRKTYGKEIGGDILEGKRTLALIHLLKHCSVEERKTILKIYLKSRKDKTDEERDFVLRLMKNYGSTNYAQGKSLEFAQRARKLFEAKTIGLGDSPAKNAIKAAIDFSASREQ